MPARPRQRRIEALRVGAGPLAPALLIAGPPARLARPPPWFSAVELRPLNNFHHQGRYFREGDLARLTLPQPLISGSAVVDTRGHRDPAVLAKEGQRACLCLQMPGGRRQRRGPGVEQPKTSPAGLVCPRYRDCPARQFAEQNLT